MPDSIEAMAVDRLAALRAARPRGPYVLGGHCNGALVALEMARRLQAEGEEVHAVVLLDAAAPRRAIRLLAGLTARVAAPRLSRGRGDDRFRRWRTHAENALDPLDYYRGRHRLGPADLRGGLRLLAGVAAHTLTAILRRAWSGPRRRARPAEGQQLGAGLPADTLHAVYRRVVRAYVPAPYAGRLVVLRSAHAPDARPRPGLVDAGRARRGPRGAGGPSRHDHASHRGDGPPLPRLPGGGAGPVTDVTPWALAASPPALGAGEVHAWCVDLDAAGADGGAEATGLSADERARAARFHFARDRVRFLRGRAALRHLLAGYAGLEARALVFAQGAHGKPALPGTGLEFNLSHSGGCAVLAVTRGRRVGVDVERIQAERATRRWRAASSRPPRRRRWRRRPPPTGR